MGKIELGGYLPLELREQHFCFHNVSCENILAVNTGRTAIWYAIHNLKGNRIHVPYYYCPDVIRMLQGMNIEIIFYHIGNDFMPADLATEDADIILLVNYYGIMNEAICSYAQKFQKVILDQCHGFFYEPVLRKGIMNVYSCRKFIGVPDGGYLIGVGLDEVSLQRDLSYERVLSLCKSIELGTNAGYMENKRNEQSLKGKRLRMSVLTRRLLANADYTEIQSKRYENFQFLHKKLTGLQNLIIKENHSIPYAYPLLLERDIHQELVEHHIYAPRLWGYLLADQWNGTLEQCYARCIVPLPIDQRYSEKEMDYLVHMIFSLV